MALLGLAAEGIGIPGPYWCEDAGSDGIPGPYWCEDAGSDGIPGPYWCEDAGSDGIPGPHWCEDAGSDGIPGLYWCEDAGRDVTCCYTHTNIRNVFHINSYQLSTGVRKSETGLVVEFQWDMASWRIEGSSLTCSLEVGNLAQGSWQSCNLIK